MVIRGSCRTVSCACSVNFNMFAYLIFNVVFTHTKGHNDQEFIDCSTSMLAVEG